MKEKLMGILKDLIDQLEEEYGPGNIQPLPFEDVRESDPPLPVVVPSDGRVLSWTNDPPVIRLYAWALQNLRFVPVDGPTAKSLKVSSGEMDRLRIGKLARELRMTDREIQAAFDQLVREGDLMFKTERGRRIYFLAPLRF
jgi:hypothetical protein